MTAHVGQQPFPKKFSLKNPKLCKEYMGSLMFYHPAISPIFGAASSFVLNHKELEIAQTVQINQLFQLLNLICVYGDVFYGLTRMLVRKNVNNDVSKDSPEYYLKALEWSDKTNLCSVPKAQNSVQSRDVRACARYQCRETFARPHF